MNHILGMLASDPNVSPDLARVLGNQDAALQLRRAQYVQDLLRFDHQFEHADDHRVWKRGQAELERLRIERTAVDFDGSLWLANMHENYKHEARS